jgi:hypothetical protein
LKHSYDRETKSFRALNAGVAQSGIIPYYGCYETVTPGGTRKFGFLLELADFDLSTVIAEVDPPVTPDEIKSFYQSMQELALTLNNAHRINLNGREYNL